MDRVQALVFILTLQMVSMYSSAESDPCEFMTYTRQNSTIERKIVNITLNTQDYNGQQLEVFEIPFCFIKDNEQCFPESMTGHSRDNPEFKKLTRDLYEKSGGKYERTIDQFEEGENFKGSGMTRALQGFSCKSGRCGSDEKCKPCSPPDNCVQEDPIPWGNFHQKQMDYLAAKNERVKLLREHINCPQSRDSVHYEKVAARIEVEKGGGVFLIAICAVEIGKPCFPNSKKEFEKFKVFLNEAKVLPEVKFLPDEDDEDELKGSAATQPMRLKSWNCASGVCDPKTLKCTGDSDNRKSYVWKLHEYMATKGAGYKVSSLTPLLFTTYLIAYDILDLISPQDL